MAKKRTVWKKGEASIEFKDGSMEYFNDNEPAKGVESVMYFYYTVIVKQKMYKDTIKLEFRAGDFPKVQNMSAYIDHIMNFDMKSNGYLMEDCKKSYKVKDTDEEKTFTRKIYYTQIEMNDPLWYEYFIRFERYDYEVKQYSETEPKKWTQYKMTIGEIPHNAESCCGEAMFFNYLTNEDLLALKMIGERFVNDTIKRENRQIKALIKKGVLPRNEEDEEYEDE